MSLHSPSTRVPRIVLQRLEEVFPAVRETMVSVLCLFAQEGIFLSSSLDLQVQRNQMFCDKVVLKFIIHVVIIFMVCCGCYSGLAYWVLER
jgi:hypothetical protein